MVPRPDQLEPGGSAAAQVARYALPLVVLVFYLTAAQTFTYTADSSYASMSAARALVAAADPGGGATMPAGETPNPLWVALLAAGAAAHLDPVLVAKVLGLLFCSLAVVCTYLIAVEVLTDRLVASCASLAVAMQSWLLQLAPSGSALSLVLVLSLATVFFLLRNDYILAAMSVGLCADVCWQAVILLVLIVADIRVNSIDTSRVRRRVVLALAVFCAVVAPWIGMAVLGGFPVLTRVAPFREFPPPSAPALAGIAVLVALVCVGIIAMARADKAGRSIHSLRSHMIPLGWVLACGIVSVAGPVEMLTLALPLVIVYAFRGVLEVGLPRLSPRALYSTVAAMAALIILLNQVTFATAARPRMTKSAEESGELEGVAAWLRTSVPDAARISSERNGWLAFHLGREVDPRVPGDAAEYVVSAAASLPGYVAVYPRDTLAAASGGGVWTVFQKQR